MVTHSAMAGSLQHSVMVSTSSAVGGDSQMVQFDSTWWFIEPCCHGMGRWIIRFVRRMPPCRGGGRETGP